MRNNYTNGQLRAFLLAHYPSPSNVDIPEVVPHDNTVGGEYNIKFTARQSGGYIYGGDQHWGSNTDRMGRVGINISTNEPEQHICLIRFKSKALGSYQNHIDGLSGTAPIISDLNGFFPLSNKNFTMSHSGKNGNSKTLDWRADGYTYEWVSTNVDLTTSVWDVTVSELRFECTNIDSWNCVDDDTKDQFRTLLDEIGSTSYASVNTGDYYNLSPCTPVNYGTIPFTTVDLSTSLPIFDISDIDSIKAFLETGDESGAIDPEVPSVDEVQRVGDWATNWFMYWDRNVTPMDSRFGIKCRNADIDEMKHNLQDLYTVELTNNDLSSGFDGNQYVSYPYYGYQRNYGTYWKSPSGGATYNNVVSAQLLSNNPLDEVTSSTIWNIRFSETSKSAIGVSGFSAYCTSADKETVYPVTKTEIDDGLEFTNSLGEVFCVYFTERDSDKATREVDREYIHHPDTDVESEGADANYLSGNGYGTYNVGVGGFNAINDYLWQTDWSTIFSQSTSPISCICSALQIPFTASGSAVNSIPLAKGSVVYSATKINPVKEYTIGTQVLPRYYKNFLDTARTKVLVYLPFCGWHELPTAEVMSDDNKVKTLTFKYVVDFINGLCRCNIYCNGTLRWSFDGNCAVNIPLTSDDHTRAVGNALKSGGSSMLATLGGAVGGGLVGGGFGAVVGAVGGIASTVLSAIPQYNYSTSGSFSGLIESTSPRKITIVIIRPDVTIPSGFAHHNGKPCQLTRQLSTLSGYTVVSHCTVESKRATENEKREIEQMLQNGVYL